MLTHEEHQAMIMFDRLLMAAKDNETVADLLDQTLNVARMIDPRPDDKVMYGPLQRMHFEWQELKHKIGDLEKRIDQYLNNQHRYTGGIYASPTTTWPTTTWPSNPGLGYPPGTNGSTGYPLPSTITTTMAESGLTWSDTIDTSILEDIDFDYSTIKIGDIDLDINNTSTKRKI